MTVMDPTNPSREGKRFVRLVLRHYVKDMISDGDYEAVEKQLLDIIRAERRLAIRIPRRRVPAPRNVAEAERAPVVR